jgi:hypothetical protein
MNGTRRAVGLLALLVAVVVGVVPAGAQQAEDELGNWLIYNGTLRFSDRWTLFTEAQLRLFEVASNLNETLVRAGGQYDLTPKALVALGVLRADTWDYGGPADGSRVAEENRIYGQFTAKHEIARADFEHRYRAEWRSIDRNGVNDKSTRFRYRLQITTPLNRKEVEPGAHFINAYDEIFIGSGGERTFDQNRLYVAWGRQFTRHANLQLGLLWQARSTEDFYRLQIFYTHKFDLRKD